MKELVIPNVEDAEEKVSDYVAVLGRVLEPDSKDNYRASRLTAIWMQASVTKAARVRPRFS